MTSSGSTARAAERAPAKLAITINVAINFRVFIRISSPTRVQALRFYLTPALRVMQLLAGQNIALCDILCMSQIGFTTTATRQWLKLSPQIRDRIGKKLEAFAATGQGDVKKLKGQAGARLRVGDWRVIFNEEAGAITVVAVGHRRHIYD